MEILRRFWYLLIILAFVLMGGGFYLFLYFSGRPATQVSCDGQTVSTSQSGLVNPCVTVSGTVAQVIANGSGDLDIKFRPDQNFLYLLDQNNLDGLQGALIVRLNCQESFSRTDSYPACYRYNNSSTSSGLKDHISYTGPVFSDPRFGWNVLYPLAGG